MPDSRVDGSRIRKEKVADSKYPDTRGRGRSGFPSIDFGLRPTPKHSDAEKSSGNQGIVAKKSIKKQRQLSW